MIKKDDTNIPAGIRCFDKNGNLCPYYHKAGVVTLNRKNCEFSLTCEKDCQNERCKNIFIICKYNDKIGNYANGDFLLTKKYKICGIHLSNKVS